MKRFHLLLILYCSVLYSYGAGIVSCAPNITKILKDLGLEKEIVATVIQDRYEKGEKIGNLIDINIEKIILLNPEYIFYIKGDQEKKISVLGSMGFSTIPISINSIEELKTTYNELGRIFKKEVKASELVKEINTIISNISKYEYTVLGLVFITPLYSFGEGTFQGDCLKHLGFKNIASFLKDRYGTIRVEFLIRKNPDMIFLFTENSEWDKEQMMKSGLFKELKAIKAGNVIAFEDTDAFLQPSFESILFLRDIIEKIEN